MRRLAVLVTVSFGISLSYAAVAEAALPESCIDRVESKSARLIQKVASEIERKHTRLENHFNGVRGAWREFVGYFRGAWVAECLDTYPDHKDRYNKWLANNAQPVSNAAAAKLSEVCSAYTDDLLSENKSRIEKLIQRGATAEAVTFSRTFENYLERPIVAECKPTAEQVKRIAEQYIPSIRNRAKLEGKTESFASRAFQIQRVVSEARAALASRGATMLEAPRVLEGAQGRADFARSVEKCSAEASELRGYGADDDYVLHSQKHRKPARLPRGAKWQAPPGPAQLTLASAESLCRDTGAQLEELFAKVEAHNEKFAAERAKVWEKKYIKSGAMRRVYNANAKRWPKVEDLGSQIVWSYRSYTTGALTHECKDYVFSRSGKLKKRRTRLCN